MRVERSFCRICIASCGILVSVDGDRVVEVRGDPDHPVSKGYTCPKGRALGITHHGDRRLTGPMVRRNGVLVEVTPDELVDDVVVALGKVVTEHGVKAVGTFQGSGGFIDPAGGWALRRMSATLGLEQNYSTASVDSIAKTYVTAMMSGTTALVPHCDTEGRLVVFVGSNPLVSHGQSTGFPNPVEWVRAAKARGEVVVIDPRRTETAQLADRHLAARPGTDHVVLAHLVRSELSAGRDLAHLIDHAVNLDRLIAAVEEYDQARTCEVTGLHPSELAALRESVRRAGRLAVVTGTGTTMSPAGNLVEWMAWALMLVTDSLDRPGGMWFNPGYFGRIDRRDRLPRTRLGEPGAPSRPEIERLIGEWPASLIPDEIEAGRLRALVIFGANAVTALPDTDRVREALAKLEVLVVIDVDHSETAELATHVIASPDQLERADVLALEMFTATFYNQYTGAVVAAPASKPPVWQMLGRIGAGLGADVMGKGRDPLTMSADDALGEVARGAVMSDVVAAGGVVIGEPVYNWVYDRLPDGAWDMAPETLVAQMRSMPPVPDLVLVPRRQMRHQSSQHFRSGDEAVALIHPNDAERFGVADGDLVEITGGSGSLTITAKVTDATMVGAMSVPHGWSEFNVNHLVSKADLDPLTGMPFMSGTAVTVRPMVAAPRCESSVDATPRAEHVVRVGQY